MFRQTHDVASGARAHTRDESRVVSLALEPYSPTLPTRVLQRNELESDPMALDPYSPTSTPARLRTDVFL